MDDAQIHTEEIIDIISTPPRWLIRSGISTILSLTIILLFLSKFINYPEIVQGQLVVESYNSPTIVTASQTGRLVDLKAHDSLNVSKGQLLAIIENNGQKTQIVAPRSGILTFANLLYEKKDIITNSELFYINDKYPVFYGEMTIAQNKLGDIRRGQSVLIKMDTYPYDKYGILYGKVKYIINTHGKYKAQVDLPLNNETDLKQKITLQQGMFAKAEIVTRESTVFERITRNFLKN